MYSLIMAYGSESLDMGGITLDRGRFLEYTNDSLKQRFAQLTDTVIEELKTYPALFSPEFPFDDHARVIRIDSIQSRPGTVRIEFTVDESIPPIAQQQLEGMLWDIDLDMKWETSRTHWAIKDVDLMAVLRKKGIIGLQPVSLPDLKITSETVERAANNAENLIKAGQGASSALDRMHTVLHGYLIEICQEASITVEPAEGMTSVFKKLREGHPKLIYKGTRDGEIDRLLKASGVIIEGLNTLRNNASVAHPNKEILAEAEAMYAVNLIRSLLHYIEAKRHE